MENSNLIETKRLSIGYRKKEELLGNVSISFGSSEIWSLLGENGTGKTTLFKTLMGLIPALDGELFYKNALNPMDLISFVQTGRQANQNMLVSEFLDLGAYRRSDWLGRLNESDKKRVQVWAERFSLNPLLQRKLHTLSDGQYQRMQICQAIIAGNPLLILDEPTAFLDFKARDALLELLLNLNREEDLSILCATHDFDFAVKLTDNHLLIKHRKIEALRKAAIQSDQLKAQLS